MIFGAFIVELMNHSDLHVGGHCSDSFSKEVSGVHKCHFWGRNQVPAELTVLGQDAGTNSVRVATQIRQGCELTSSDPEPLDLHRAARVIPSRRVPCAASCE